MIYFQILDRMAGRMVGRMEFLENWVKTIETKYNFHKLLFMKLKKVNLYKIVVAGKLENRK